MAPNQLSEMFGKIFYLSLSACNQTISLLPSEVLTEAENKSFEGQAKFWRASICG